MKKQELLNKPFNITSVCRSDMVGAIGEKRALAFSDDEMRRLASKMANAYCNSSFWIDLPIIADDIEEERTS